MLLNVSLQRGAGGGAIRHIKSQNATAAACGDDRLKALLSASPIAVEMDDNLKAIPILSGSHSILYFLAKYRMASG